MNILGINSYHESASAAIVCDGRLVAAAEEERFNRVKYCGGFPSLAIRYCLKEAGLKPQEIDHLAIPRKRSARLVRKIWFALHDPSFAWKRSKDNARFSAIPASFETAFDCDPASLRAAVHHMEHHQAHLASGFFVSPFEEAALFSVDSLGDFSSCMWGAGKGNRMRVHGSTPFPHSLGIFYSAVCQYLGFPRFGDEYKVMGLAAYGEPHEIETFRELVRFVPEKDGFNFRLALDYFLHHRNRSERAVAQAQGTPGRRRFFSDRMVHRLGPPRGPEEPIEERHRHLAASLQARLAEVYLGMLRNLARRSGSQTLCLAGGVAFNCAANGKIFDTTPFERVYVHPAAGDAGLAVGAAFYVWHQILGKPRSFVLDRAGWGPGFTANEIRSAIQASPIAGNGHHISELSADEVARRAAALIADGQIIGWFQGRSEWGPRALGNRSILADPRRPEMKQILNERVKHREIFRPFAPSVLAEASGQWFEHSHPSPFMSFAFPVRPEKRAQIPAPTHVDGTGRLQTVTREANPLYWQLIKEFEILTGVPVVLNTSFNDNEPIVNRPEEALDCFLRTKMDALVLGNYLITKQAAEANGTHGGDEIAVQAEATD